ncbi:MAG: glycosyltransferase family 4 protein, partial [Methylococcales bacterium]|nr:glycosyltransferase family 4 protein [Methylococcales bacterium]
LWMQTRLTDFGLGHFDRLGKRKQAAPDILHFPNNTAPLLCKQPYILTIHDASLYVHPKHHPWQRHLALRSMMPTVARRAAAIITPSKHARTELSNALRLPLSRFRVIYEAGRPDFCPNTDAEQRTALKAQYNLPDQFILFVGTLEPRKNLARLVDAFARIADKHPKIKLVLAGGTGWKLNGFSKKIERLNLENRILRLGYVPDEHLAAIYSLASVLAYPSLYEGFGLPPLEAMACGTPVLTSSNSPMQEVCGRAAHYINPRSVDEIADGLENVLWGEGVSAELTHRGIIQAKKFSWHETAHQTLALYEEVAARQHLPHHAVHF